MKLKNKYQTLLYSYSIKWDFINEVKQVLIDNNSSANNIATQVGKHLFTIKYSELTTWSTRDKLHINHLSESGEALLSKLAHMAIRYDFASMIRMLYSFRNGTKRLSNPADYTIFQTYECGEHKDGQEYIKHTQNCKRAHFRWNRGGRYILSDKEVEGITKLIDTYFPDFLTQEKDRSCNEFYREF